MTNDKRQLRAEAVKRLMEMESGMFGYMEILHVAIDWNGYANANVCRDILVELLTDDCDIECYECARLAELVAENGALRAKADELTAENEKLREGAEYLKLANRRLTMRNMQQSGDESRTCESCDHSRIERHTGDEQRVCWVHKAFGLIVADGHFCGYWEAPAACQTDGSGIVAKAAQSAQEGPDDDVTRPLYRFGL